MSTCHHIDFCRVVALNGPVCCHRRVPTLRIARQHDLARETCAQGSGRLTRGTNRVDHRAGLRVGVEVRVVWVFRLGKAQVVGGDHRIALRGIHRCQHERLAVPRVGQGARFLHIGALGIGHQPGGCRAVGARGQQQDARGIGFFTTDANGLVIQGHNLDIAFGGTGQGRELASVKSGDRQRVNRHRRVNQDTTVQRGRQRTPKHRALAQVVQLLAGRGKLGCQVVQYLVIGITDFEHTGEDVTCRRSAGQVCDLRFDVSLGGFQASLDGCSLCRVKTGESNSSIGAKCLGHHQIRQRRDVVPPTVRGDAVQRRVTLNYLQHAR